MSYTAPVWAASNSIMLRANFSPDLIRRSQIWAAKDRGCPRCTAPPYYPCVNLVDLAKSGYKTARKNKGPHPDRIDFDKLEKALREKGYR